MRSSPFKVEIMGDKDETDDDSKNDLFLKSVLFSWFSLHVFNLSIV